MTRPTLPAVMAVIAAAGLTAACSSGGAADTDGDSFAAAATGLCDANEQAANPAQARRVFFDSVHQPLHDLADETATVDRGAAADLLEAKQGVEASLDADGADLAPALTRLVDATDTALAVLDRPGLPCLADR